MITKPMDKMTRMRTYETWKAYVKHIPHRFRIAHHKQGRRFILTLEEFKRTKEIYDDPFSPRLSFQGTAHFDWTIIDELPVWDLETGKPYHNSRP